MRPDLPTQVDGRMLTDVAMATDTHLMAEDAKERRVSWLCATQADRARVLDMEPRLKPLRTCSFVLLGLALLVCGPWIGWWTLIPLAGAGLVFYVTNRGLQTSVRPEYRLAFAWLGSEFAIAASVALTGGPRSPALAWLVLPVVTLAARFNVRGVLTGSSVVAGLILVSSLGVDPSTVISSPQYVVFCLALLGAVALLSVALMRSDVQHRTESVIDPLTSMLNRNALSARIDELRDHARIVQQPIGLILGDLDHFKVVNDTHGHIVGDAVLRDVAYCLRKRLRAFDLAYRLGGEEFLVVLPGADLSEAALLAEALRETLLDSDREGVSVTMSFGVSASEPSRFDYEEVFHAADLALYEAKAAGRNCVRIAPATSVMDTRRPDRPGFAHVGSVRPLSYDTNPRTTTPRHP